MTNTHMKQFLILLFAFCSLQVWGWEREPIWPEGKMPDAQASQIAAMTDEIKLVLQLFGLSFIIAVVNFFLDEYTTLSIIGSYLVKYVAATCVVMLFGFMVGWFYRSNFWMAFIYVGIVLVLAFFIDAFKTKKDIEFINARIKDKML